MDVLHTIDSIKSANARAGYYFFTPDTLRFFRSKVGRTVYQGEGGVFFTTSEQFIPSHGAPYPRLHTVRKFNPETGDVGTVGEFQAWGTGREAGREAKRLAIGKGGTHHDLR